MVERAVCPDEGVLDQLFRVEAIASGPEGDREEAVLMGQHERLEGAVEIRRELGREPDVGGQAFIHHTH